MEPLDRADATLSRAREQRESVITPDTALSPMDESTTVQLHRTARSDLEVDSDPDATTIVPRKDIDEYDEAHHLTENVSTAPLPDTRAEPSSSQDGRSPENEPDQEPDDHDPYIEQQDTEELVPTTTHHRRSEVARRLDGG